jgi:hypothetical protein
MLTTRSLTPSLLLLAAALPLTAGDAPATASTLTEAFAGGSFNGGLRYRFDNLDMDSSPKEAHASTLRANLTFRTLPFYGLSGYLDLYNVSTIGKDMYFSIQNAGDPDSAGRPLIADPEGRGVNEAYGRYANKDLLDSTVTVGRQLFTFNDEVFLTASRYRQNNNRFDTATIESKPIDGMLIQYGYIWNHIDVFDFDNGMSTNVGNVKYGKKDIGSIAAYGILLDYDDVGLSGRDTTTFGLRVEGPFKINDDVSIIYEADIAKQTDSGDNDLDVDADYLMARVGISFKKWYLSVGYRSQSGADGSSDLPFEASWLGYPWPWRGDTEQMVLTPTDGLKTIMVWAGGAIPPIAGLSFDVFFWKFDSDVNSIDYGSEISGALNYSMPFDPKWYVSAFVAQATQGDDNAAYVDATRVMLMTGYNF